MYLNTQHHQVEAAIRKRMLTLMRQASTAFAHRDHQRAWRSWKAWLLAKAVKDRKEAAIRLTLARFRNPRLSLKFRKWVKEWTLLRPHLIVSERRNANLCRVLARCVGRGKSL
uniref:Uncharacterized protein n=1 Tax=Haptolina brevifila TaxID=156173 RepID=A0A7S2NQL8_9EUKA|mmetsp:Transcript_86513/g.172669  ORF Transcript_86513/g.172669 Transcript_86513/m.172669 type:complete len:113 (+) Transcript_86513:22-360(+)|eukprot:CAMPEP_0174727238 /NCGR_PEP_ID=MMETSP1094-20130205/49370_1 /TAXON_ID=156173 /ORGANISM="Chrysochromulina brevifilum, Strain UTEX LB 985" /LENGTH=112 /DNA_ID=CAMNT_0015928931 /DNA_START=14 /DNA_END=352 /DNA_ORIENTATION=-